MVTAPYTRATDMAKQVRYALTNLGYCYELKDGQGVHEISFKSIAISRDAQTQEPRFVLLEVDTNRLPRRVLVPKLKSEDVLHQLTAVVGSPVAALNTRGLTYAIPLTATKSRNKKLPRNVHLDLNARPRGRYMIPIGVGLNGPIWKPLPRLVHILVGGETGSGKSTWLNAMLLSLLTAHEPDTLRLAIIDPKMVEFTWVRDAPHLLLPVATDLESAEVVTAWLMEEMNHRKELFTSLYVRTIEGYNEQADEPLPRIVAVVDEFTDLALQCGADIKKQGFYKDITRLVSGSRSLGITLVLATQMPKAQVINTLIRENCSTRIAFRVRTKEHSKMILGYTDEGEGAFRIPKSHPGGALAVLDGPGLIPIQGYNVSDEDLLAFAQRCSGPPQPQGLTDDEVELARFAIQEFGGEFPVGRLAKEFGGVYSKYYIENLAKKWEHRGLLTPPPGRTQARRCTEKLQTMVTAHFEKQGGPGQENDQTADTSNTAGHNRHEVA